MEVETVELEELKEESLLGPAAIDPDKYLSVVKDVEIRLSAVLGKTTMTVGELIEMREGRVLALDKLADEPIELVLSEKIVARGILVVVDDNFGIQLTEICEL